MARANSGRFVSLDGWRGISILLVLASHLLPLGPSGWQLNIAAGMLGMVLFFTLSGFLVTLFLLTHDSLTDFLLRRFFRIIPLAWVYMTVTLLAAHAGINMWLAHFLFYANAPPQEFLEVTGHLWSLCVEVHFYLGVALLFLVGKRRGLLLIPLLCLAVTALRMAQGAHFSSETWYRIDEILVGAVLALLYTHRKAESIGRFLQRINPLFILPLLLLSCHPYGGALDYLRPYFGGLMVAITLFNPRSALVKLLDNRVLIYLASISYALYVLHPALADSWLGSGDAIEKYAKRPLLFAALFMLAHFSTRYFEQPCINFGRRLSTRWRPQRVGQGPVLEK